MGAAMKDGDTDVVNTDDGDEGAMVVRSRPL
jgi:hypothetical protein